MLKFLLVGLLLISCTPQENSEEVVIKHFQNINELGIRIIVPEDATIQLLKVAKPGSKLVSLTGAKIKIKGTQAGQEFEFIIRNILSSKNIADYVRNVPARNSLSSIAEICNSKKVLDAEEMRIYSIEGCSFAGFIPVYGIGTPRFFLDVNVEDNGQEIDFKELKKIVLSIRPLESQ